MLFDFRVFQEIIYITQEWLANAKNKTHTTTTIYVYIKFDKSKAQKNVFFLGDLTGKLPQSTYIILYKQNIYVQTKNKKGEKRSRWMAARKLLRKCHGKCGRRSRKIEGEAGGRDQVIN